MKDFSKTTVLLGTAFCAVAMLNNPASATKANEAAENANISKQTSNKLESNSSYNANGSMDKKTAMMLINLLRNPHLQVRAEINGQRLQTISPEQATKKNLSNVLVNYTITGKTDRKTVLKLKKLMQNSKHIQISAHMNINTNQQRLVSAPRYQNYPQFIGGYTPFYSNSLPPVYVQDNTIWMPVPINTPLTKSSMTKPEMIAGN